MGVNCPDVRYTGAVHGLGPLMKYIFLLTLLGCSDLGVEVVPFPGEEPGEKGCISVSPSIIDFGVVRIDELPVAQTITIVDECGILEDFRWELDDPEGAFELDWDDSYSDPVIRLTTTNVDQWEAQFIGDGSDIGFGSVQVQIFAETTHEDDV